MEDIREKAEEFVTGLRCRLREELNACGQLDDTELYERIDRTIQELGLKEYLSLQVRTELRSRLFDGFRRLGILQELVDNQEITEIMVNGKDNIFIETHGCLKRWDRCFESTEQLEDMIQQIDHKQAEKLLWESHNPDNNDQQTNAH